jgi:D-apionolactonase
METVALGPLSFLLDGADLRYLELNGTELLRRVTVAVRDEAWGTLEPDRVEVEVTPLSAEAVEVVAECSHRSAAADVAWTITARVTAAGELSYATELRPRAPFRFCRMGICLLHPPAALVGADYEAETPDGTVAGTFSAEIGPQRIEGEEIHPLFPSFSSLRIRRPGGIDLDLRFEGDLFEMEDQRNWSDGSFKTYGTPLSVPRPQDARPEQPVRQRVELTPGRPNAAAVRAGDGPITIEIGETPRGSRVPDVGLFLPATPLPSTGSSPLPPGLEHVRVDLRPSLDPSEVLGRGGAVAEAAGAKLLVALHLRDQADLAPLGKALGPYADRIARLLVFDEEAEASTGPLVVAARRQLGDALAGARFAGGTDLWFAQINRMRPDPTAMDGVAWSVTPQVHGTDSLTVMEGVTAEADQVASARAFAPGLELLVGPLTLRPRYNPAAADAAAQALNPPPESVDPRQGELFAAAFTAGSLAQLAGAGATSVTLYEVGGPRGVLAEDGGVLPCWHPIADLAAWAGRAVLASTSPQPLAVQALAVRDPDRGTTGLLVANLRDRPTEVRLDGVPAGTASVRVLDAQTRAGACADPTGFRAGGARRETADGSLTLDLGEHAVATVLVGNPA